MGDEYILVTPVKNEEKNLNRLINNVKNQILRPLLWVIVNDGSTDKSSIIIKKAAREHSWIKSLDLLYSERDIGLRYAYVCKRGFEYAIEYAKKERLEYEYIGLLDADMIIDNNYFEKLIAEFKKNPRLGIASGEVYSYYGREYRLDKRKGNYPVGSCRLWRKKCFEETGGYIVTYSPDTVSNIKAILRGWEIKRFPHIVAKQTRRTSEGDGFKKGYIKRGEAHYYLYHRPIIVFLRFIKYLFNRNFYLAFYYLYGYMNAWGKKMERISDEEIIRYFKNRSIYEYVKEEFGGSKHEKV